MFVYKFASVFKQLLTFCSRRKVIYIFYTPDLDFCCFSSSLFGYCVGPCARGIYSTHGTPSFMHPLWLQKRNSGCILPLSYAYLRCVKMWGINYFEFWKCSKTGFNLVGIDETISSAQCHPHCSWKCTFFIPAGRARSFVIVCLSLPLPIMVSC